MNGTRRASRLWTDRVTLVLERGSGFVLRTMSVVFWHPVDRYLFAVWRDDFGAGGTRVALERLTQVLPGNFESKELGIGYPNKCGDVKPLSGIIEYMPGIFLWHNDVRHAGGVVELMGKPAGHRARLGASTAQGGLTAREASCVLPRISSVMSTDVRHRHTPLPRLGSTRHSVLHGSLHVRTVMS